MVSPIQFAPRQWTLPPEDVRRLCGPAAANWTEDQLYAANQLMTWVAKQALKNHRERRRRTACHIGPHGLN